MNSLRQIIFERISLIENMQQADKAYFIPGMLSPKVRDIILHITGGDAYSKIVTDLYWAEVKHSEEIGHFIDSVLENNLTNTTTEKTNDVLDIKTLREIKAFYLRLKSYNKNVFPIKDYNPSAGTYAGNMLILKSIFERREKLIELLKQLPSVAVRNMKDDIRTERDGPEFQYYLHDFDYFLAHLSLLGNRDEKTRNILLRKMFKSNITLKQLLNFVEEKQNLVGGTKLTKSKILQIIKDNDYDLEIAYNQGNVLVVDVLSAEGIKELGCNSLWCFTYGSGLEAAYEQWNKFSTNGHVYAIIDFSHASDSEMFMHVLIKPLDYKKNDSDSDINNYKLFNMANDMEESPLYYIDKWVGLEQAPMIFNFGYDYQGPTSKWPFENPNQLKLDLQEIARRVQNRILKNK